MPQDGENNASHLTGKLHASPSSASTKKPYKVVLESVTQEKKKLRSTISYELDAPSGYTYVPVGAPELTEYCKELSRKRGVRVFIVSADPKNEAHKNPNRISHHIHRIGHHFRNDLVDVAFELLGYTSQGPRYIRNRNRRINGPSAIARRLDSQARQLVDSDHLSSQDRERKKVAGAIKDLFPKIPTEDLEAIVTRAFKEGTARVGNADLPLARRVQLAVLAHIRHTKTDYDSILKSTNWQNARQKVEQACLDQIVKWRGEEEDGQEEMEDIFQEVIVLDDESDNASARSRDSSIEIISEQEAQSNLAENAYDANESVHAQASWDAGKRSDPEIVHVQPRRAIIPPPVLQQTFRRRWNETRARLGMTATAGNHNREPNRESELHLRSAASALNDSHPTQTASASSHSRQERIGHGDVYPSIEISDRQQQNVASRPRQTANNTDFTTYPAQKPLVLFEQTSNAHEIGANKPFYVPNNRVIEPNYGVHQSLYDAHSHGETSPGHLNVANGGKESFQGVKRKSLTRSATQSWASERAYLSSPMKRVRLIDQDVDITPVRVDDHTWQYSRPAPHSRNRDNPPHEPTDYPPLYQSTHGLEYAGAEHRQDIHVRPSHDVEYVTISNVSDGLGHIRRYDDHSRLDFSRGGYIRSPAGNMRQHTHARSSQAQDMAIGPVDQDPYQQRHSMRPTIFQEGQLQRPQNYSERDENRLASNHQRRLSPDRRGVDPNVRTSERVSTDNDLRYQGAGFEAVVPYNGHQAMAESSYDLRPRREPAAGPPAALAYHHQPPTPQRRVLYRDGPVADDIQRIYVGKRD